MTGKKKILIQECFNLLDSTKWGLQLFKVLGAATKKLQDTMIASLDFHFQYFGKKMISPTMSKST
jgi:hypothetical protein